jgi:hypothetical protein
MGIFWPMSLIYSVYLFTELFCEFLFKYLNRINGTNFTIENPEFSDIFPNHQEITWKNDSNELHRSPELGPAVVKPDGTIIYYENGKIHRSPLLGPAYINANGDYIYYEQDKMSRPSSMGPAYVNSITGSQIYYEHGKKHRPLNEGPAVINYELDIFEYWINDVLVEDPKKWEAAKIIQKNWRISKYNEKYREFFAQVLMVPKGHDSKIGQLFPNGGKDYQIIVEELKNLPFVSL